MCHRQFAAVVLWKPLGGDAVAFNHHNPLPVLLAPALNLSLFP